MTVQAATGSSTRRDSYRAGQDAAREAVAGGRRADLVLLCAAVLHDHDAVLRGVRSIVGDAPIIGGSSFGEMTERGFSDDSVIVMVLTLDDIALSLAVGDGTDQAPEEAGESAARTVGDTPLDQGGGQLGLLVAEMRADERPLLGMQRVLGTDFPLFGGCCSGNRHAPITDAAFSLGYQYSRDRVTQHAVALAVLRGRFSTAFGVAHGWQLLGTEVVVGRTEGSTVYEIDGEPALDFYARFLGDAQPTAFPLGVVGDDHVVLRSARAVADDRGVTFTAPIPTGCKVRLTRGNRADILASSEAATRRAMARLPWGRPRAALVVSCISRRTMLGTRVRQELEGVRRALGADVPLFGFYAAGEYAPRSNRSMYHNCTFCLCLIGEPTESHDSSRVPDVSHRIDTASSRSETQTSARQRVLLVVEDTDVATQCTTALQGLADELVWCQEPAAIERQLEPEYAQVVVFEAHHGARISPYLRDNPAIRTVVLARVPATDWTSAAEIPGFVAYCHLPLAAEELRFWVGRAQQMGRTSIEHREVDCRLQRALRELKSAEDAVETSERLLTETYRAIEVASRNMRVVLDNVQQGFVTLDREGFIAPGWSRAIERLLGPCTGGQQFAAYLGRSNRALGQLFGLAWDQVMAGILPLEVTMDLLPRQWIVGPRHLRLEYVPVQGECADPDSPEGVVVVVTDATAEVKKREAEAQQQEAMEIFQQMIRDPDGVTQFARDATKLVEWLTRDNEQEERDPVVIRRVLHTLKGNCGVMGLHRMAATCHDLEDDLAVRSLPGLTPDQSASLRQAWRTVADVITSFQAQRGDEIAVSRKTIQTLSDKAAQGIPGREMAAEIRTLLHDPVRRRLERLADSARALAKRLGKDPLEVIVQVDDLRLESRRWDPLWTDLVHAVRNAVDHGIRVASGSTTTTPRITLRAVREGRTFSVSVADNGPGVDWERVAAKATQLDLPATTRADLTAALFADSFTTRPDTTETSGRGVGLSALRRTVERLGGTLEIHSEQGRGTILTAEFELPR